jgi:hypothetical protein
MYNFKRFIYIHVKVPHLLSDIDQKSTLSYSQILIDFVTFWGDLLGSRLGASLMADPNAKRAPEIVSRIDLVKMKGC